MLQPLPPPARYVPWREAAGWPHIVVDGASRSSTVLTLSHWPSNATPERLKRDTSTETVFAYLNTPSLHSSATLVTNNHFDEDGLFSMFALCAPQTALRYRELLMDAARAGDFGSWRRRDAARLCFVIEAHAQPALSPFPPATFHGSEARQVALLYRRLLKLLPKLLARLDAFRRFWTTQDEDLATSEEWLQSGRVVIEEEPELDLAIIRIPTELPTRPVWRYLRPERTVVHPFAIHNATRCTRLVRLQGRRIELQYRYESWLQIASRRPALRVDLTPFRHWLNRRERHGRWIWEDTLAIAPRLYLDGQCSSSVAPAIFLRQLRRYLRTLPPAWDPYNWTRGTSPGPPGADGSGLTRPVRPRINAP